MGNMTSVFSVKNNLDLIVETSSESKRWGLDEGKDITLGLSKTTPAASRFQTAQADSCRKL
jgi:hypothetical protein